MFMARERGFANPGDGMVGWDGTRRSSVQRGVVFTLAEYPWPSTRTEKEECYGRCYTALAGALR
jgi:hypothetical protein